MNDIENYLLKFPDDVQVILRKIRKLIQDNATEAEELLAYGMPGSKPTRSQLYILQLTKSILGFTPHQQGIPHLKTNAQNVNREKVQSNFPSTNPYPMNS